MLHVIKAKITKGFNTNANGYHSVWSDLDKARDYAAKLNAAHSNDMEYTVLSTVDYSVTFSEIFGEQARFRDSIGYIQVNH